MINEIFIRNKNGVELLMPCPSTGPKMFWSGPNFFELYQKLNCI